MYASTEVTKKAIGTISTGAVDDLGSILRRTRLSKASLGIGEPIFNSM